MPKLHFFWADRICHPIWPIPGSVTATPYNISSNSGLPAIFYGCFFNKKFVQFPTTCGFMKQTLNSLTWNSTWGNYRLWKTIFSCNSPNTSTKPRYLFSENILSPNFLPCMECWISNKNLGYILCVGNWLLNLHHV